MAREDITCLRRAIARIEGRPAETLDGAAGRVGGNVNNNPALSPPDARSGISPFPLYRHDGQKLILTGVTAFDAALGGGLQVAALTEMRTDETRHAAALSGFALCLAASMHRNTKRPLLWLSADSAGRETGLPYLPGICGLSGLQPGDLFTALGRTVHDTLWIAEEAGASGAFAVVLLELRGNPKALGLEETRRLQRRAALSGSPLFLLRAGGVAEPTAAPVRIAVAPAPSVPRRIREGPLEGSIGAPAFTIAVEKARAPSFAPFVLEWNANDRYFTRRQADPGARPATPFHRPDCPDALGPGLEIGRTA